jgi:hypothetical protein
MTITTYSCPIVTICKSILAIFILPTNPKVVAFKVIAALATGNTIINYIALI